MDSNDRVQKRVPLFRDKTRHTQQQPDWAARAHVRNARRTKAYGNAMDTNTCHDALRIDEDSINDISIPRIF